MKAMHYYVPRFINVVTEMPTTHAPPGMNYFVDIEDGWPREVEFNLRSAIRHLLEKSRTIGSGPAQFIAASFPTKTKWRTRSSAERVAIQNLGYCYVGPCNRDPIIGIQDVYMSSGDFIPLPTALEILEVLRIANETCVQMLGQVIGYQFLVQYGSLLSTAFAEAQNRRMLRGWKYTITPQQGLEFHIDFEGHYGQVQNTLTFEMDMMRNALRVHGTGLFALAPHLAYVLSGQEGVDALSYAASFSSA